MPIICIEHIQVRSIDDKTEDYYDSYNSSPPYCPSIRFAREIHLLPGMHTLTVDYFHRQIRDMNLNWMEVVEEESKPRTIHCLLEKGCVYELSEFVGGDPVYLTREVVKFQSPPRFWIPSIQKTEEADSANGLLSAAAHSDLKRMRSILEAGTDINVQNIEGQTALHAAALNGQTEAVKFLIRAGADVHVTTDYGVTALHLAAKEGHTKVARLLIEAGADVNAAMDNGTTALICAKQEGRSKLIELLKKYGAKE